MKKLVWNVYYCDMISRKINVFNVFDHYGFTTAAKKHLKKCKTRDEFAEELRHEAVYYFWSKSEWELILSPWVSSGESVKIDVYDQLRINWDHFVDYVWEAGK